MCCVRSLAANGDVIDLHAELQHTGARSNSACLGTAVDHGVPTSSREMWDRRSREGRPRLLLVDLVNPVFFTARQRFSG